MTMIILSSCGGNSDQTANQNNGMRYLQKNTLTAKNACESIDNFSLEVILDWVATDMIKKEDHFDTKFSICNIRHLDEALKIHLSWKSEVAINNELLTKDYEKWMDIGDNGRVYTELERGEGYQIIYNRSNRSNNGKAYLARKRFGDASEVQIEFESSTKDEEYAKAKLVELLSKVK